MQPSIFTPNRFDFERLDPHEAVEFFRALLWAEASRLHLPLHRINIPNSINVADGGVDASIAGYEGLSESGIFIAAHTGYQIKASEAFQPHQKTKIKQELFDKRKEVRRENLGESVRQLLDNEGAYVLVCFKQDLTKSQRLKAESLLHEFFIQCGYPHPQVAVWGQSEILGLLQPFPSLLLRLSGRENLVFETHESWARHDDMRVNLQIGATQSEFVANLQTELRRDDEAVLVHICGEAGVGKTRLVLEATSAEELRACFKSCTKLVERA